MTAVSIRKFAVWLELSEALPWWHYFTGWTMFVILLQVPTTRELEVKCTDSTTNI